MKNRFSLALVALFALAQSFWIVPASAAQAPQPTPTAAAASEPASLPANCPAPAKGDRVAQLAGTECCSGQKGICGCRAGKLVCCDSKPTTQPGCACHGDDGLAQ